MGSTPTKSAKLSGLPFYVWEAPGKPISIQLQFDMIDGVSPDILRGLGALKRRGAEVGGLLLGRREDGSRPKVIVEDFAPVPSEYLTGPSYNLSENDLVAFEAALERWKSGAAGPLTVVGFYRSHTRDELYMDDADLALARRYFPEPGNVFLLVKPFATRPSIAGFFFWEGGEIYRESSYLQFPFDRRELGGGERLPAPPPPPPRAVQPERAPLPLYTPALIAAEEPSQPAVATSSLSILSAPQDAAMEPNKPQWRWLLAPGFLAIALVIGFFAYRNLDNAKASASILSPLPALPLKLSVSERKGQLDVTWDRNAPAVANGKHGVLSIADGVNRQDLELSGPQLRYGRVLYSRLSGDVNLRLEVFPEGQASVVESIRIISTEGPPQKPVAVERPVEAPKPKPKRAPIVKTEPVAQPSAPPEVELLRPERRR